jgi:hypothetical protein
MKHLISKKEIPDDEYAPDPKLTEHLFPFKNVFIASGHHFFQTFTLLDAGRRSRLQRGSSPA